MKLKTCFQIPSVKPHDSTLQTVTCWTLEQWTNMLKLQDDTLFGGLSLNMDPECNESKPTDFCLNLLYLSSRDSKNWRSKHPQFLFPTRGWAVDGQVRPHSHPLSELSVFVARLFVSLASYCSRQSLLWRVVVWMKHCICLCVFWNNV